MIRVLQTILDTVLMIIAPNERGSYLMKKTEPPKQGRDKEKHQ